MPTDPFDVLGSNQSHCLPARLLLPYRLPGRYSIKHNSKSSSALAGIAILSTPVFAVANIARVDVGRAVDPATGTLHGAVDHACKIGKYRVTNAQDTESPNSVDPSGANAKGSMAIPFSPPSGPPMSFLDGLHFKINFLAFRLAHFP